MKKTALLIALMFVILSASVPNAYAKDLEECHHCDSSGKYACLNCHNEIWIVCDLCGGAKTIACEDCGGAGWKTCPSCSGDGYLRSGDGTIPPDAEPGSCGNCGGSGRLECWSCHWAGFINCTRCGGAGGRDCDKDECVIARAHDWKCPFCMGTGYLLTNFWPGENDGVQNMPSAGDLIWKNGKSTTYGGSSTSSNSTPQNEPSPQTEPEPQNEPLPQTEPSPETEPEPQNEPSLETEPSPIDEPLSQPEQEPTEKLPEYNSEIIVGTESMTSSEREAYNSLDDTERAEKLREAAEIISTAEPQRANEALSSVLEGIAARCGRSAEDARIMPISFTGHLSLGFPVRVAVSIPQGALDGGGNITVFHAVEENGAITGIENLGRAEYMTYPDGYISGIVFYTTGFSDFFTIAEELSSKAELPSSENTPSDTEISEPEHTESARVAENKEIPGWIIPVTAVTALATAAVIAVLTVKKKG